MPHFVVDCSKSILSTHDGETISKQVHMAANSTGLFGEKNIQVRVNVVEHYRIGNIEEDSIHVFASILEGRTIEQKLDLSKTVIEKLAELFPQVSNIGIDIKNLEKGTGFNKSRLGKE